MSNTRNALSNSSGSSLIVDIQEIDKKWHQSLELMTRLVKEAQDAFCNTDEEISCFLHEEQEPGFSLYKVISTMTGHSIRIMDAVLSLLQCGHPDAALGCVRTLFELYIDATLISLDSTRQRAKQYEDYDLGNFLEKIIKETGGNDYYKEKLSNLKEMYNKKNFKNIESWTQIPGDDGCPKGPRGMDEKIDYVAKHTSIDSLVSLKSTWNGLNKWAHMTPLVSQNLLGFQGVQACLREEERPGLLGKSTIGLNVPMHEGSTFLILMLIEYFNLASKIANKSYDDYIRILNIIKEKIQESVEDNPNAVRNHYSQ